MSTPQQKYPCLFESCGKTYASHGARYNHTKSAHPGYQQPQQPSSDEKRIPCHFESCGKAFSSRGARHNHTKTAHPGYVQPSTQESRDTQRQQRTAVEQKTRKCPHCSWATTDRRKQDWIKHIERSHPDEEIPAEAIEWRRSRSKSVASDGGEPADQPAEQVTAIFYYCSIGGCVKCLYLPTYLRRYRTIMQVVIGSEYAQFSTSPSP